MKQTSRFNERENDRTYRECKFVKQKQKRMKKARRNMKIKGYKTMGDRWTKRGRDHKS